MSAFSGFIFFHVLPFLALFAFILASLWFHFFSCLSFCGCISFHFGVSVASFPFIAHVFAHTHAKNCKKHRVFSGFGPLAMPKLVKTSCFYTF